MNELLDINEPTLALPSPYNLEAPKSVSRNGKIARLPKATRDMINRMLDDGLPYHVIIDELGEAGEGLNSQNLTNWKQGGYQDYLKHQDLIERSRVQMEVAADLVKELGADASQIHEACHQVAAAQMFGVIWEHGTEALKKALEADPLRYLTLVNTVCNLSNSIVKLAEHRAASSQIKPNQAASDHAQHSGAGVSPANSEVSFPSASRQLDEQPQNNTAADSPTGATPPARPNLPSTPEDAASLGTPSSPIKPNQGANESKQLHPEPRAQPPES